MQISQTAEDVAGEVRAWMGRRRRSGRSAAAELGWTEVYLSRRLTGQVPFDVTDLAALAGLLDVPVTAFFLTPDGVRTAPIRSGYPKHAGPYFCPETSDGWHCNHWQEGTDRCCACGQLPLDDDEPVNLYRSLLGLAA